MTCHRNVVHQPAVAHPVSLPFVPCIASAILAIAGVHAETVAAPPSAPRATVTPIEHLIVVVGENLSFDNLFATYEPAAGQSVANLLSRGIVNKDGGPGPRFAEAAQRQATVRDRYSVTPPTGAAFTVLPQPSTNYAKDVPHYALDTRFPADLPNGPFRITRYAPYTAAVGDPVHRFFQMWQQIDGGKKDLFTWVGLTSGEGSRKRDDPLSSTNQGGIAMGFYSMSHGDAPYFRELAQNFAIADNYHQSVMGGTGANFVVPPQVAPNIGTALEKANVSWKWYSGGRIGGAINKDLYCSICDPLTHSTAVMTTLLRRNLQGVDALFRDLDDEQTLPAVSFVIPPNPESGHPAYSTVAALERFVMQLVTKAKANPAIWSKTAILVTTDEGGGYYDSGYDQILDFFGDGTRVPLIGISPSAKRGYVDHTYYDHASVLKFIEYNWRLTVLSDESCDNLPNP